MRVGGGGVDDDDVDFFEMFEEGVQVVELQIAAGVITALCIMKTRPNKVEEGHTSSPSRSKTLTAFKRESSIRVFPETLWAVSI